MLVPCGGCLIVTSLVLIAIGVFAMIDSQRFDPFYQDFKCTSVHLAAPVPLIMGFKPTVTDVPFSTEFSFTLAGNPDATAPVPIIMGAPSQPALDSIMGTGALVQAFGLPATTTELTTTQTRAGATALNPALANATDAVIKTTLMQVVGQQLAAMPNATVLANTLAVLTHLSGAPQTTVNMAAYPKEEVTQAAFDAAPFVPVMTECTNPNELETTIKENSIGKVYAPGSATYAPLIPIGHTKVLGTTTFKKDKPKTMALGMKMQLTGAIAKAFSHALDPTQPGSLGIGPLFFDLSPLKSSGKVTVLGMEQEVEDEVPNHFCGVLVNQQMLDRGDGVKIPHLAVASPSFCRHSFEALFPVFDVAMLTKYAAHQPTAPVAGVPLAPLSKTADMLDKFAADPQKVADEEDKLNSFFMIATVVPIVLGIVFLAAGIACIVMGSKKSATASHIAQAA